VEDVPHSAHLQRWACSLKPARFGVWAAAMEMFQRGNRALRHCSRASAYRAGSAVVVCVPSYISALWR